MNAHETLEMAALLGAAEIGTPQAMGDLVFVPLLRKSAGPDADFLDEVLAKGEALLTEINEVGVVQKVRLHNRGPRLVLLVDGEHLEGCKQNRIVSSSFLVPQDRVVEVPVACVERGRWHRSSDTFRSSGSTAEPSIRASNLLRLIESLEHKLGHDVDQQAVWREVDAVLESSGTHSPACCLYAAYEEKSPRVEQDLHVLAPDADQVGMAVVSGRRLVSLDLFGSASLYGRGWKKIARGVLFGQRLPEPTEGAAAIAIAARAIDALLSMRIERTSAPGCGETLHGRAGAIVFGAVGFEGRIYHGLATEQPEQPKQPEQI